MNSIVEVSEIEDRPGILKRQFAASATPGQLSFDLVFGILMPLLCFYLDPGIIGGGFTTPLGKSSIFIYVFSGLAILTHTGRSLERKSSVS